MAARRSGSEHAAFLTSPGDRNAARRIAFVALPAALLALLSDPTGAATWEVIPTLSVRETYTDNLFLAPEAAMQSEWTTQLVPGISIRAGGARLRFDAWYAPEIVSYAERTSEDEVYHRGSASGNVELAEKLLFLDAGAKIDQYNVSLQGPLTISNVNVTGNRATAATYYLSPYLKRDIGSVASAEARFTYSAWRSDDAQQTLPENDASRVDLRLTNGPGYKLLTWEAAYAGESIRYETQQETITQVFTLSARRLITPTVGLLAQAGYESFDTGLPEALQEQRYSAGFEWTPTPRTRLAATAGRRLDDETYSFDFRHRTRLTTWSATYKEDVTTSRSEFFLPQTASTAGALDPLFQSQYPDPAARQKAVEAFIARTGLPPSLNAPLNFFSDQLFVQKRWLASVALQGIRNSLVGSAFWQLRKPLTGAVALPSAGDFAASESIQTAGGSLAWSLRLTPRNIWNLDVGYTRSEFLDSDRVDDFTYLLAGVTRRFQPRVSGALHYRLQRSEPRQGGGTGYTENSATASLSLTF
jgi:uncharacterized protein (PEP-CTERM system associated)